MLRDSTVLRCGYEDVRVRVRVRVGGEGVRYGYEDVRV